MGDIFDTGGGGYSDPGMGGGGGGANNQGTTNPWYTNPDYWLTFLNYGLGAASAYGNYRSQQQTNSTNIKLQREAQAFTREMSDTAVQRRRRDIELAGGNPALAFTNGQEASSPVVSPARTEAPQINLGNMTGLLLAQAEVRNLNAQTALTTASARKTKVDADNAEMYGKLNAATDRGQKIADLEMRELEIRKKEIERDMSALQLKKLNDVWPDINELVRIAKETGKLNLENLKRLMEIGGIQGTNFQRIINFAMKQFGE